MKYKIIFFIIISGLAILTKGDFAAQAEMVIPQKNLTDETKRPLRELPLTLEEAVAIALRDNRDILLKGEAVKKAKKTIEEAKAAIFPTLTLGGAWNKTMGYNPKDIDQASVQASLRQSLYRGGAIINTIKYNGFNFEIAQAALDKTKIELAQSVKKAFLTLLLAEELSVINKAINDNTQEHYKVLKERYNYGQVSESDILKIGATLNTVEQAYEASLNQAESGRELLGNLLSLDKEVWILPEGNFEYEIKEIAYDEAFLKALESRPEIKQYESQTRADEKAIEIAKAENRPNIYAAWDYYGQSRIAATTTKNWNDYNVIGISVSWPVFDGGQARAKIEQAMINLKETQILKEKITRDIALELRNAYLALKNAMSKIKTADSDIIVYSDNLKSANQKYGQGMVSKLDIDDADLKYHISLFNKKQTIYDYLMAKSDFDKATGGF